jgi:hypothetical protein
MNILSAEGARRTLEGFDPVWYAAEYPDVAMLGMDPAQHYHWIGRKLGRRGAPRVSVCNADGHDTARVAPPSKIGKGSPVSLLIDNDWYRDRYLEGNCDKSPQEYYEESGAALAHDPNPYFDVKWYLTKYPDVAAAGVNPVEHYYRFGASEGRNPGPRFNTRFYAMQLDKADSLSGDLLVHFLKYGRQEGKLPDASAIRAELSEDALGTHLSIAPTNVTIGIVAYKQDVSELIELFGSIDIAIAKCGPNVSASIVIFDNGMTITKDLLPRHVDLKSNGWNGGFGRAHNEIMKQAFTSGGDIYIGVNPDGALHRDCLKSMIRMSQRHEGNALIEAIQFPEEHPKFYHPETLECDWVSGACFLITRDIWNDTKGFDENIFLYCEDVDLSWTARRHGYKTLTCPSALFYHDVSDRGYSEHIWREMLTAGRYLAHKWQNPGFREKMEDELLAAKFFQRRSEMPKLDDSQVLESRIDHTNFGKMFSFTATRW